MDEFGLISRFLAPLAGRGSLGLLDDAALHCGRVVAKDILVDGVHFRARDGLAAAAQKAVRANVSDMCAMGARPEAMLLGLVWPTSMDPGGMAAFAEGLGADIASYGLSLLGGDTTRAPGPLVISITMTGVPAGGRPVRRSGARPGDVVMVTGTIGDGALGLISVSQGKGAWPGAVQKYLRPTPPTALVPAMGRHAAAAIDISDGLLADAHHVAATSGVRILLDRDAMPLSDDGRSFLAAAEDEGAALMTLLTGGDDYELLITAPPARAERLAGAAAQAGVPLTVVGHVAEGAPDVILCDTAGSPVTVPEASGYRHF